MSYHDRNNYQTRWSNPEKEKSTKNPKIKIISPQKKLIDIQKILNDARASPPSMYELHTAIQNILDGE
tara:strand:+ start:3785 stop:3988 length:204 start_codon:yes stop_codon:yes gene_type:complete